MGQALSISALARSTGVTSKTLRYWERVGLLPKVARTHTEYRIFGAEVNHYIDFILKAKRGKYSACICRWHGHQCCTFTERETRIADRR